MGCARHIRLRQDQEQLGHLTTRATIYVMQIAVFLMRALEIMFFVGLVGSAIVVMISFVEDAKELSGDE